MKKLGVANWIEETVDLSFARGREFPVRALPIELAVLLVGVAARQAASPTARAQVGLEASPVPGGALTPAHGAFHGAAAEALTQWQDR
jgi:hypothetical protein